MNEMISSMMERRSIRQYEETRISKEIMAEILNAGAWAPSGMNNQSWKLVGIIDPQKVKALAAAVKKALGLKEDQDYSFYGAPAFIIVSNERDYRNAMADSACAMENMMLAAYSMGIGTVWINQLRDVCDDPGVRALLTAYGIPEDHQIYACCCVGYGKGEPKVPARKDGVTAIIE